MSWVDTGTLPPKSQGSNRQEAAGLEEGQRCFSGASRWEAAVFRPASSLWSVRGLTRIYLGSSEDCPVPADYDGDGTDDAAIFRDADGTWSVRSVTRACFGGAGDVPATR